LFRKAGYRVHALGGPEERGLGDDSVDLVGKLSLGETLQEVATSALHLAADTGTGHIASAYQIPVVSVFGPMNPAKYRPYGQNVTVLRESNDPGAVKPESIVAAGQKLLEETRERRLSLS
jgi:ADP-heptose:LPS heptosyltransferase